MGTAWRYRRCPGCGWVGPASDLRFIGEYGSYWNDDSRGWRQCPECGRTGYTSAFTVVRETRKGEGRLTG